MAELINMDTNNVHSKVKKSSSKDELSGKHDKGQKLKIIFKKNKIFMRSSEEIEFGRNDSIKNAKVHEYEFGINKLKNEENSLKERSSLSRLIGGKKKALTKSEIIMLKEVLSPIKTQARIIYKHLKKIEGRMTPRVTKKCIISLVKFTKSATKKTVVDDEKSIDLAVGGVIANTKNWANKYIELFDPLYDDILLAQNVIKRLAKKHPENAVLRKAFDEFERIKESLAINMKKENMYLKKSVSTENDIFYDVNNQSNLTTIKSKSTPFGLSKISTIIREKSEESIFYDAAGEKVLSPVKAKSVPFNLSGITEEKENEEYYEDSLDELNDDKSSDDDSNDDDSDDDEFFDAASRIYVENNIISNDNGTNNNNNSNNDNDNNNNNNISKNNNNNSNNDNDNNNNNNISKNNNNNSNNDNDNNNNDKDNDNDNLSEKKINSKRNSLLRSGAHIFGQTGNSYGNK